MTNRELDQLAERYLNALDAFDVPEMERIWELASKEPQLETMLFDLQLELDREATRQEADSTRSVITAAVQKHLPSAEIVQPISGPVTVGQVAEDLFRKTPLRMSGEAVAMNERLRTATEPLPAELGLSKLIAWAEANFGPAPRDYWVAFRTAAILLELRQASEIEYQLAARAAPKPEDRR